MQAMTQSQRTNHRADTAMRTGSTASVMIGLLSVAPLAFLVFSLVYLVPHLESEVQNVGATHSYFLTFQVALVLHGIAIILSFLLVSYYGYLIRTCKTIATNSRFRWVAVLLIGNIAVFPVFWYLLVWRTNNTIPRA